MRVFLCIVVLSVISLNVTSAATAKNKVLCSSLKYTVTINKDYEPYWYQKKYTDCVDGSENPEIPAETLTFYNNYFGVLQVKNFPKVKEIFLDNTNLNKIPDFVNLPALQKISLSNNKLRTIESINFQRVPVTELIFSTNRINKIEDNSFGPKVETIYLTCNNLTKLSPTWFQNPAGIRRLNLGGNKITSVPDYMFKDFVNLNYLELRNNEIISLGIESLSGPSTMNTLQLAYNNITDIKENVFGPKVHIERLDIQYNRLSFLNQGMMDKMTAKDVKIWGNPWQCPCKDIIFRWIAKNNKDFDLGLTRDEDPSCIYALSFNQHCVPFVDDELYKTFLMTFETFPIQFC